MAPHSSTLAWKIPWMEEPGRLQSMGSRRVGHDWATSFSLFTFHFHALEKEMATHSSVLAWRILGTGEPCGLPSMGSHRVGRNWSDLATYLYFKLLRLDLLEHTGFSGFTLKCSWINLNFINVFNYEFQSQNILLIKKWGMLTPMYLLLAKSS